MPKTVWILGAGFSASLGGPLLRDLFSKRMELELKAVFGITVETTNVSRWLAFHLYDYGVSDKRGLRLWRNAEEYLDRLDSAAPTPDGDVQTYKSSARDVLWRAVEQCLSSRDISALHKYRDNIQGNAARSEELNNILLEAKRWMAAECCAFLKTADPTSERWEPYRDWLATLTADDTVVTFNYDRVIETLVAHVKDEYLRNKYQVLLPNESLANDCIHVLKLHGSVDWQRSNGTYWKSHDTSAIKASLDSIAIATPG